MLLYILLTLILILLILVLYSTFSKKKALIIFDTQQEINNPKTPNLITARINKILKWLRFQFIIYVGVNNSIEIIKPKYYFDYDFFDEKRLKQEKIMLFLPESEYFKDIGFTNMDLLKILEKNNITDVMLSGSLSTKLFSELSKIIIKNNYKLHISEDIVQFNKKIKFNDINDLNLRGAIIYNTFDNILNNF
jgi:hypothetical protein